MPIFLMMVDSQEWKEARRSYKVKSEYLRQIKQLRKVLRQERNIWKGDSGLFMEIRKRFSEEQIQFLLKLEWWNWPIEKITKNLHLLTGNNLQNLHNLTD